MTNVQQTSIYVETVHARIQLGVLNVLAKLVSHQDPCRYQIQYNFREIEFEKILFEKIPWEIREQSYLLFRFARM